MKKKKVVVPVDAELVDLSGRDILAQARSLHRRSVQLNANAEVVLARAKKLVAENDDPTRS